MSPSPGIARRGAMRLAATFPVGTTPSGRKPRFIPTLLPDIQSGTCAMPVACPSSASPPSHKTAHRPRSLPRFPAKTGPTPAPRPPLAPSAAPAAGSGASPAPSRRAAN
eukprot:361560-Chlamydomonas_euryale.AAC.4